MTYGNEDYRAYAQSESGKLAIRKYQSSEKGRARRKRYENSELGKEYKLRAKQKVRELISAAKNQPCSDCKQSFPACCMDFHHVTGKKSFNIGSDGHRTAKVVQNEIAKCVVICSNCHRIRHAIAGAGT